MKNLTRKAVLSCGAAVGALAIATGALAQQRAFDIPAQPATKAVPEFARQAGIQIITAGGDLRGLESRPVKGEHDVRTALALMLAGTGISVESDDGSVIVLRKVDQGPQSGSAAGDGAGTVDALIVTAQKREEDIQDVPIAISAFTQEDLTRSQVAGGPDLMTQVPNMTFTKTNFSSYSIQLRGIGTQAISATTDPAVAVAFNNTPFIRNRFFEQEFYDLQRVEVLRGPQGTLYGRNATAGVVNIISAKPILGFEAKASADLANYNSMRLEGMINLPLAEDVVALRLAGAWTRRDGYSTNEITGNPIDGRELWSTRLSLRFAPTDRIDVNLIWEHFEEDDDRLRSGKQLCNTDEVTSVAGFATTHFQTLPEPGQSTIFSGVQGTFSQGCTPTSLYAPESFQTPNGIALPYYVPLGAVFLPIALNDPYVSRSQSPDLRVIESTVDPEYRAKSDVLQLQASIDLTDSLTLSSETAWASDFIFSTQDFNRFNTAPGAWATTGTEGAGLIARGILSPDGVFCDPQVGCSDRLVAIDLSTAKSRHFSQEFRLGSNFDGPFNFSLGANFLRYDTEDKYYVFINSLSLIAAISPNATGPDLPYVGGVTDNSHCLLDGFALPPPNSIQRILQCTYMDPNPIGSLNDMGHNYFLSRNPYKLISYAAFGEAYFNITDNLKVTGGVRWTVDKKEAPRIPSWLLASNTVGYPVLEVVEQEWREPTGRLTIDWKPALGFTDETLLYASFARGYKAGGANPPPYGIALYLSGEAAEQVQTDSATNPKTFDPEFVNAFELGAKNTLLDGRVTVNTAAFYYDYKDYQISQIVDRSAVNDNFDAEVWGVEIEASWRPLENLRLGFKGGYENTRVADGMRAIDIMDRTAGDPNWVLVRPFPSIPSNCILPAWLFVGNTGSTLANPELVNLGSRGGGQAAGCELAYVLGLDPVTGDPYVANPSPSNIAFTHEAPINYAAWSTDLSNYPGWPTGVPLGTAYPGWDPATAPNNGEGIEKDLSGNELPNAPDFTATITADYTAPLPNDWLLTLHTDLYYQSEAWTRIFNTEGYDKLKAYTNVNLAAILTNEAQGWTVMAYAKNIFDRDSITGAFLNSDDTGLTTNVFLTEPRLYGIRVTKAWSGGPWWSTDPRGTAGGPYPFTVELGGQVQRHDAPYASLAPSFSDEFPGALNIFEGAHNRDLDWGDGRNARLSYRLAGGPWQISAGVRYGKTNGSTPHIRAEAETDSVCRYGGYTAFLCAPDFMDGIYYNAVRNSATNFADAAVTNREEHQFADFSVGREIGVGGLSRSSVTGGVQFAQFKSQTSATVAGVPDWVLEEGFFYLGLPITHHHYEAVTLAERDFEGVGPVLSWDASQHLLGSDGTGYLDVDWSVGGGVLFGKQKVSITGAEDARYYSDFAQQPSVTTPASPPTITPTNFARSNSVTSPFVDVSLGLSYEIQRIRVSTGYRWQRHFNVLDVGFEESSEADRTVDGPFFKIALGLGG